jgi:DNA-binding MarR family transcriptional regulator
VKTEDYVDQVIAEWRREKPDMETIGLATVGRIFALYKHLEVEIDRLLREFGLPLWGFDVLFALRRSGPPYSLQPTQLMKACYLTSGAMTHRLDRIEGMGLIRRSHNAEDRRSVCITLLPSGQELVDRVLPVRVQHVLSLLEPLSQDERDTLANLLKKLLIRLESTS